MAITTTVATFGVVAGLLWYISRALNRGRSGRKRSLSFSSEVLLRGAFPEKSTVWQPIINTVFYVNDCPRVDQLVEKCKGLLYYDRFRSALSVKGNKYSMVDLGDNIDIVKDIIETVYVDSFPKLVDKIDQLASEELKNMESKPLWKLYRIVNKNKGHSAILVRVHHAIGDGISLIGCMSKFFDDSTGKPVTLDIPEKMGGGVNTKFSWNTVWNFITSIIEVCSLATSPYDSNIKFTSSDKVNLVMSKTRKTIHFPTLKLDFVKELKKHANVTVNDILMAGIGGAIRRYSQLKNDPLLNDYSKKLLSRALLPVAFPRKKKSIESPASSLRNLWSFVSAPFPINETTAKDRVNACAASTKRLKSSPMALVQLFIQNNLISIAPEFIQRKITQDVFSRHTMVFSNLPGPSKPIYLCEEKIQGLQIIFPNLIPQIIILSYSNGVFFNMSLDPEIVDSSSKLSELFLDEMTEMAKTYGVSTDPEFMLHEFSSYTK